jgi:hypothetical protein
MPVLADERGERLLGICPPADSTVLDFVRVGPGFGLDWDATSKRFAVDRD